MASNQKYFLARSGKISGPFSEDDLKTLETRGELLSYAWIWAPGATDWKALDPKPNQKPPLESEALLSQGSSEAYALWGQQAIRGTVQSRTELGFELVYSEKRMLPALAKGMSLQVMDVAESVGPVHLSLMKISEIERKGDSWVLNLRHQNS